MKKIISLIVISVMLLSALAMNVGAADEAFPKEVAEALLKRGFEMYEALNYGSTTTVSVNIISFDPLKYDNLSIKEKYVDLGFTGKAIYVPVAPNGTKFPMNIGAPYNEISPTNENEFFGRRITSMDDINSLLGEIFSGDALARVKYDRIEKDFEKFIVGDNGNVYMLLCGEIQPRPLICEYGELNVDGNKASMVVILGKNRETADSNGDMALVLDCEKVTVDFEKTSNGWRISGGELFDRLYYDVPSQQTPSSPNTGDETAIILALLVLSGLAVAVVPRKRRKR